MSKQDEQGQLNESISDKSDDISQNNDAVHELPIRKENSSKKIIIAIIFAVIVAAVVVAAVWYWFSSMSSHESEKAESTQQTTTLRQSETFVLDMTTDLSGEGVQADSSSSIGGQTESGQIVYEFAPYQVQGTQFKSLPAEGTGRSFASNESEAQTSLKTVGERLKSANFKELSSSKDDAGAIATGYGAVLTSYAVYASNQMVCALSHVTINNSDAHVVGLGCSSLANYEKAAQAATPLYEAYVKSLNSKPSATQLVYSTPSIKNGADNKKHAVIFQKDTTRPDGTGIYYYYSLANEWKFLTSSSKGTLNCTVFNTQEIKEAFKGIKCYENTNKILEL